MGQQDLRQTLGTLATTIRAGELQHGGVREGIREPVVELQKSQPKECLMLTCLTERRIAKGLLLIFSHPIFEGQGREAAEELCP